MEEDKTIGVGEDDEGDEEVHEAQVGEVQVSQEPVNEDQVNENPGNEEPVPQTSARQEEIIEPIASQSGPSNSPSSGDINEPQERRRSSKPALTQNPSSWKSSNPFINFVRDFRANFLEIKQPQLLQLAGEHWRGMSDEEKHPYITAAKLVRNKNAEIKLNTPGPSKSTKLKVNKPGPSKSAKLKINKPGPKRKRQQSKKVQMKKRQKTVKKPKIIAAISDSDDSGEESDISGESGKTMDSENDSIDSDN